jgi:acetyltransferase EpsM
LRDLIVIGGGGHARVVIEAARSKPEQWRVIGFVDPSPCEETQSRLAVSRLGGDEILPRHPNAALVLGIGNVDVGDHRQRIVGKVGAPPSRWATVIHNSGSVSPTAEIGSGTVILAGAVVNSRARIGEHCIINSNAIVDHDVLLGAFIHASHGCVVAGGSTIGDGSYIGMGALVRDHITLGRSSLVGMGAAVTKSFEAGAVLVGVPARNVERRG